MERTAGDNRCAANVSDLNISGFKHPAFNRQCAAGSLITENQCFSCRRFGCKGAALDGDSSAIDPQWRPAGSSLDFSAFAGILDGQGRTGFAQLQPSRQRAAVQIQRVIAGNIEFFTRIRCSAIRQQGQRAAVRLLHCGKGVRNVGVVHIPHLCHGVLRRDFRRLGRRLRLNRRLFVCGGRFVLGRFLRLVGGFRVLPLVRSLRLLGDGGGFGQLGARLGGVLLRQRRRGQERQAQGQRHEHTQYSFFHKILL